MPLILRLAESVGKSGQSSLLFRNVGDVDLGQTFKSGVRHAMFATPLTAITTQIAVFHMSTGPLNFFSISISLSEFLLDSSVVVR